MYAQMTSKNVNSNFVFITNQFGKIRVGLFFKTQASFSIAKEDAVWFNYNNGTDPTLFMEGNET